MHQPDAESVCDAPGATGKLTQFPKLGAARGEGLRVADPGEGRPEDCDGAAALYFDVLKAGLEQLA